MKEDRRLWKCIVEARWGMSVLAEASRDVTRQCGSGLWKKIRWGNKISLIV